MPRSGTTAALAAIQSTELKPAILVTATFVTGPIYVWSGLGSIVWNGNTWLGVGTLGSVSVIEEGSNVEAKGITLSFGGFDPTLLTDVLTEFQLGAPVTVYLALFAAGSVIATPFTSWAGRMDQPTIDVAAETASISINCESRLLDMNISVARRYTNEDQQIDYPGDRGLEFVSSIAEAIINWGRVPSSENNI